MDTGNTIPCSHCGARETPQVSPGAGPHAAALVCRQCGTWLKWARKEREVTVMHGLNKVLLVGHVSDRGIDLQYLPTSQPLASFTLVLQETSKTGEVYKTFCPCEIYGKGAEAAGEIDAGMLVLVEGKLRWKKGDQGKDGKLVVAGFEVKPLTPAAVAQRAEGQL